MLVTPVHAKAEPPDACASLREAGTLDHDAEEVFFSVKQSDDAAACFLVPSKVVEGVLRLAYRGGDASLPTLAFDPDDLLDYLSANPSISVGSGKRAVGMNALECLANPKPLSIAILPNRTLPPETIEAVKGRTTEVVTDLPGYHRYSERGVEDLYFTDIDRNARASFWCHIAAGDQICSIVGEYDRMRTGIMYQKAKMTGVKPEKARQCLQAIAELFRMTTPVGVQ
jgi:hypothetical protein